MDVRDISWSTLRTQQRKRPSRPLFPNCSPCRYLLKVAVWPSEVEKEQVEREVEREAKAEEKVGEVEVKFSTADKEGGAFGASLEC